jgi:hypothetical protein
MSSGGDVPRVRDAAGEGLHLEQREPRERTALGEESSATTLDHGVDEQPELVDEAGGMRLWQRRMLPVTTMSLPGCSFRRRTSVTGSPDRTTVFCHAGPVMVEETTYFCTRFR